MLQGRSQFCISATSRKAHKANQRRMHSSCSLNGWHETKPQADYDASQDQQPFRSHIQQHVSLLYNSLSCSKHRLLGFIAFMLLLALCIASPALQHDKRSKSTGTELPGNSATTETQESCSQQSDPVVTVPAALSETHEPEADKASEQPQPRGLSTASGASDGLPYQSDTLPASVVDRLVAAAGPDAADDDAVSAARSLAAAAEAHAYAAESAARAARIAADAAVRLEQHARTSYLESGSASDR